MKFKRLIPALAMLLVSAILLGTSTFAWFSMNTEVSATDMKVKAVAEDGIVIASYSDASTAPADADFADEDATYITAATELKPVFTADAEDWYHAASKKSNDGQDYTDDGYEAVDNVPDDPSTAGVDETENYYQLNKFQIKSTGTAQAVYVKEIAVATATQDYSPAIRVAIVSGDHTLIYAPESSNTGTTFTEVASAAISTTDAITSDVTATINTPNNYNKRAGKILDDVGATAEDVFIYIYFDGEDDACMSDNIPATAFEQLEVSVTFTSTTPAN